VLDENFLLHRRRALQLLELMQSHGKRWALSVFSSARVLRSYTIEQIVGLGIGWIWMGIEGRDSRYPKLGGIDTRRLVKSLQSHGIRVLGSSIIGLENHRPETMEQVIEDAVAHGTDFHQFMLYTPNPGTPLYAQHRAQGTLLDEQSFPPADAHGQYRFNYRHAHIHDDREEEFLLRAFRRDYEINGPSLARLIRTLLRGWQRYKHHTDPRIRERYRTEVHPLRTTYAGAVWAMRRHFRRNPGMHSRMDRLLKDICREFGWKTRLAAMPIGLYAWFCLWREQRRLAAGWRYEPATFLDKNAAARTLKSNRPPTPATRIPVPVPATAAALPARR
jgi:hypothetical protein